MSISTIATSGVDSRMVDRLAARAGRQHRHAAALQHAAEREDVAHVVVDHQHLLARPAPRRNDAAGRAFCCFSAGRSATTRCRNSAVSSSRRSGDSTSLTTTLRASVCSRASSSGVSSLPVKTTTGTSPSAGCVAQLAPAPRSRSCPAAADRAPRSRTVRSSTASSASLPVARP